VKDAVPVILYLVTVELSFAVLIALHCAFVVVLAGIYMSRRERKLNQKLPPD
jgi:hypothetical protein